MVNPKENSLMGSEVTEGSWKKARMVRTALIACPVAVARQSHLRKAFPGGGSGGDMAEEPVAWQTESPILPRDRAEDSKHLPVPRPPRCVAQHPTPDNA